jgi:large subunit ribosomal protein L9
MQVLFTQNVQDVARKGEVKSVKNGYYRNFLMPRNLAIVATDAAMKQAEKMRQSEVIQKERLLEEAKEVCAKIAGLEIVFKMKAKGDKLYGSVTEKDIGDEVEKKSKVRLEKKHIVLSEPIKVVGSYEVPVKIEEGAEAMLKVEIQGEEK